MYLPVSVSVWFTASPTCSSLFCSHNLFNIDDTSISCMFCCDTRNLCTCLVDFCNQTPTNNQLALSFFYHVCLPTHLWRQWQGANNTHWRSLHHSSLSFSFASCLNFIRFCLHISFSCPFYRSPTLSVYLFTSLYRSSSNCPFWIIVCFFL